MSPEETGMMRSAAERAQDKLEDEFDEIMERLKSTPMGLFTLEESLVIHRFGMADLFQFQPHLEPEDVELLRQAEIRIQRHQAMLAKLG